MAKARLNTNKYSLVFATIVAFMTVCTAGVSTFAWFQANASATVTTTSDTAEITVAAPDDLDVPNPPTLYAHKNNFTEISSGVYNNHGYKTLFDANKVSMIWEKKDGSNYFYSAADATSKYGFCPSGLVTNLGSGHSVTIFPEENYTVTSVVFTVKTSDTTYTNPLRDGTWTNKNTLIVSDKVGDTPRTVTVTPVDGTEKLTCLVANKVALIDVTVNYSAGDPTTWDLTKMEFSYCGTSVKATLESSSNKSDSMVWYSSRSPAFITDDFVEINPNGATAALLSTTKLAPGYKLTFAIKAVGSQNVNTASFYLEKYKSIRLMNRYKMSSKTTRDGTKIIAIDEAIKIYGSVNASGWYFGSGINRFDSFSYTETPASISYDPSSASDDDKRNIQYVTYDSQDGTHPYSRKLLGNSDEFGSRTVYFFFTIEFSNENATYYDEYDKQGADAVIQTRPESDYKLEKTYNGNYRYYTYSAGDYTLASPQPTNVTEVTATDHYIAKTRYFVPNTTSPATTNNSNCYAGLSFQINRIKLELA